MNKAKSKKCLYDPTFVNHGNYNKNSNVQCVCVSCIYRWKKY